MAETVKFTEARFAAIRARVKSGRVEFQDEELPELRLRVSPTSAAWSVLKRIPGGPMSRVLIGQADDVAAGEARQLARIRNGQMQTGVDTNVDKRTHKATAGRLGRTPTKGSGR